MTDFTELQQAQRDTDASIAAMQRALDRAMSISLPPITVTQEDKLRGAILEACYWLREGNAPGKALEVLEQAIKP